MQEDEVTGAMVYYYYVCKRKLWYFLHEIRMEHDNQDVELIGSSSQTTNRIVLI